MLLSVFSGLVRRCLIRVEHCASLLGLVLFSLCISKQKFVGTPSFHIAGTYHSDIRHFQYTFIL